MAVAVLLVALLVPVHVALACRGDLAINEVTWGGVAGQAVPKMCQMENQKNGK